MKEFLDHFAAILGVFSIGLLTMSVSHEYGYFLYIGSHFQTFLTTTDYLANGVLWLPLSLFGLYGLIDWDRLKEVDRPKRDWGRWKNWIWPSIVALFFVALFATSWPPTAFSIYSWVVAFVFVWSRMWKTFVPSSALEEPFLSIARQTIRLLPPTLMGMFAWGWINGALDMSRFSDPYIVRLKSSEQTV